MTTRSRAPWASKYFSVPVIFVGGRENELAPWTSASGGGWVVDQGDVSGRLAAIEEARDASERTRRGRAALAYAREHFSPRANLKQIADLVESLSGEASLAAGLR